MAIRFPASGEKSSDGYYGWLSMLVDAENNNDQTTTIHVQLLHYVNYSHLTSEGTVVGDIIFTVGGTEYAVPWPDNRVIPLNNSSQGREAVVYEADVVVRRTAPEEKAAIYVGIKDGSSGGKRFYVTPGGGGYNAIWDIYNNLAQNYEIDLPWIALNSSFTDFPESMTTNSNQVIKINSASDTAIHTVKIMYGESILATYENLGSELALRPVPRDLFTGITDTSIRANADLITYIDGQQVGQTVRVYFMLNADSGMRPYFRDGAFTFSPVPENNGLYLKGTTTLNVRFNADNIDMSQTAGMSITACSVSFLGNTFTDAGHRYQVETGAVTESGSITVRFAVTDRRGRQATEDRTISVLPYYAPTLIVAEPLRCNAQGGATENGTYLAVFVTSTCAELPDNAVTVNAEIADMVFTLGSDGSVNVIGDNLLSPDAVYTLTVRATDLYGGETIRTIKVPSRFWAIQFVENGNGVAFGQAASRQKTIDLPEDWVIRIGDTAFGQDDLIKLLRLIQ